MGDRLLGDDIRRKNGDGELGALGAWTARRCRHRECEVGWTLAQRPRNRPPPLLLRDDGGAGDRVEGSLAPHGALDVDISMVEGTEMHHLHFVAVL